MTSTAQSTTAGTGPMRGIRVVEIGDLGELAGKLLADAGADVIRVEPPRGARSRHTGPFVGDRPDPNASLHFADLNTNKRGIVLDLAQPESADTWRALVRSADIVIDAVGPDVLDDLGLGAAAFAGETRLIWCAITPFGLTGPWRNHRTTDLVSMALGGIVMMCGYDDHSLPPVRPDGEHSLNITGVYAAISLLAALRERTRTGEGQHIDLSIHDCVAGTTEGAYMNWEYLGQNPQRRTGRHAGTPEAWQMETSDGKYVVLFGGGVPRDKRAMRELLDWMDEYGAAADLRDAKYEAVLYLPPREGGEVRRKFADTVAAFVASRPAEEIYRRGQAIGMPWGPVRKPEENLDDLHWADRNFWIEGEVPGYEGQARYPGPVHRYIGMPRSLRRTAPTLGQHTQEVLEELGR